MQELPLVSIIIPVYNKAKFVDETLESALSQTYPHIELVLINDGSTDGSLEILETYKSEFPDKIILIDQMNGGVSKATNAGIQASKGDYIQFLDADDLLSPHKIENQVSLLKGNHVALMASCEWLNFRGDFSTFSHLPYRIFGDFECGMDWLLCAWNHQEMMQPAAWLTHRDLIVKAGPWNEKLTINQDGEFFCRVLLNCRGIAFESEGKVYYRIPGVTNVSQQKSEGAFASLLESYRCYEKAVLNVEDSKRVRIALKKVYQKFLYDAFPTFPQLRSLAEKYIEELHVSERAHIGGPKFQFLSKVLGFKNALRLKRYLQNR